MKLKVPIRGLKIYAFLMVTIIIGHPLYAAEKENQENDQYDRSIKPLKSTSIDNECQAVMQAFGIGNLTRDQERANAQFHREVAKQKTKAYQFLSRSRSPITDGRINAVRYLQTILRKEAPTEEEIRNYLAFTGTYITPNS